MTPRESVPFQIKQEDKATAQEKVAVLLLDIDGCIFPYSNSIPTDKPIEEWLIKRNKVFLDKMVEKLSIEGYKKVVVGYFTNRQSHWTDQINGLSCIPVLPILQSYLQSKLQCEVVLDPFWTADIYSNEKNGGVKQAGESYKLVLQEKRGIKELKKDHSQEVTDKYKVSLLYAHAHRAAHFHPTAEIDIFSVDDLTAILDKVQTNYSKFSQLLPKSTCIHFIEYKGMDGGKDFRTAVKGTGEIDHKYDWGVRYLITNNFIDCKTAAELKKAHEKNAYSKCDYIMCVGFNGFYSNLPAELKDFCTKEYPKLNSTLGEASNYTNASTLYKEGLIEKSWILDHHDTADINSYQVTVEDKAVLQKHLVQGDVIIQKHIITTRDASIDVALYKGREVVIKFFPGNSEALLLESYITSQLQQSPYIIKFDGYYLQGGGGGMILKKYTHSLRDFLKNEKNISLEQQIEWGKQLALGLVYIHENGWLHQDLKLSNIFIDELLNLVIADFGVATRQSAPLKSELINYTYQAPELAQGAKPMTSSDIYSFGTMIWQLVNKGKIPFEGQSEGSILLLKLDGKHEKIAEDCPPFLKEIILSCWQDDPSKRPTAKELAEKFTSEFAKYPVKKRLTDSLDKDEKKSGVILTSVSGTLFKPEEKPKKFVLTETWLCLDELKEIATQKLSALTSGVTSVHGTSLQDIQTKIKEWKINIDDADRDRLCIIEITSPLTNSERVKANNIIKIYPYARDFIDQSTLTLEELEKECNEGFVVKRGKTLSK